MKERPILFSGPMVRVILDGTKTQTRRIFKTPGKQTPLNDEPDAVHPDGGGNWIAWYGPYRAGLAELTKETYPNGEGFPCKYGKPGDRLYPAMEIPSLGRNYCADTSGQIWSRARNGVAWKRLTHSRNSKGYMTVTPAVDGGHKTKSVHRLVAEAFYGPCPGQYSQVRHLDGNSANNAPDNLDYGSQQDNWSDRLFHGGGTGESHHAAKLTQEQADEIRTSDAPQRYLAAAYGVSQAVVWGIRNKKIWTPTPRQTAPNLPRWASRITLEITAVRVERLQDITAADVIAEGVWPADYTCVNNNWQRKWIELWDGINGKRASWESNPWVWVLEFRRVEQ